MKKVFGILALCLILTLAGTAFSGCGLFGDSTPTIEVSTVEELSGAKGANVILKNDLDLEGGIFEPVSVASFDGGGHTVSNAVIVASGSKDGTPWRVAVENPEKYHGDTKYIATRTLTDQAMATSGSYERVFNVQGTRHHLLNPATGHCTTLPGASVVAPTAMEADALATALCVLSRPVAFTETLPQVACLVSLPKGQIRRSSRWS